MKVCILGIIREPSSQRQYHITYVVIWIAEQETLFLLDKIKNLQQFQTYVG